VNAALVWLLAATMSVTSPHAWPGPSPLVATSPGKPVAHAVMTVAASGMPAGITSASVLAGSAEQPMRRLQPTLYRASFLAPQAGPLSLAVHFWRRGVLYEVPGGTILVQPKR
jgi:hypothetical protein